MADIPKQEEIGFLLPGGEEGKKTQRPDGSVLLDMERLSLLVDSSINAANTAPEAGAMASPRAPMIQQKSLTRKFSQRSERKAAAAAAADGGGLLLPTTTAGRGGGREGGSPPGVATPAASPASAVASDRFAAVILSPAAASEAAAAASPRQGGSYRRSHSRRAAAFSRWLDPRRVLLLFATLSSMGTIILLYFTLSMGRMDDGGDANAR